MRSQIGRARHSRIVPIPQTNPAAARSNIQQLPEARGDAAEPLGARNDAFQLAQDMESPGKIDRGIYHENTVRHFPLEHGAV